MTKPASDSRRAICRSVGIALSITSLLGGAGESLAQDSSLLANPPVVTQGPTTTLENSSFIFRKLPPEAEQRELKLYDIITVLVDEKSSMLSEGDANTKRTMNLNAVLSDWLHFNGKNLIPSPQSNGDQRVNGSLQSQYKAQSDMELKDSLSFKMAAKIVDIQPNGNLVIEGHREVIINDIKWQLSLTGIVRRQSIGPDRIVRSESIDDLQIDKRAGGFVNDGVKRGWFTEWYDKWKPF